VLQLQVIDRKRDPDHITGGYLFAHLKCYVKLSDGFVNIRVYLSIGADQKYFTYKSVVARFHSSCC